MGNSPDPVLIAILSALMGLLGGLLTIPISVIVVRMLKSREQEPQRQLELFAKKQDLLLRHRLELQRQSRVSRRIKLSIAELKNDQAIQAEEIDGIHAAHDSKLAAIGKSMVGLEQEMNVLVSKEAQLDERLMLLEKRPIVEDVPVASIAELNERLSMLEQLHDGLDHT